MYKLVGATARTPIVTVVSEDPPVLRAKTWYVTGGQLTIIGIPVISQVAAFQ